MAPRPWRKLLYPKDVTPAELSEVIATMQRHGLGGRFPDPATLIYGTANA